ncbi:ribonuclease 1-like [Vicia villosa]|uniref:ribonuclease 1-like n=1 Tax=Vicia villosa TaxID=3911 RepID=UPI00273C5155|nr:ribonuclease 1-like [Vicia villosa]
MALSSRMIVVIILIGFTFSLVGAYDYLSLALKWQPGYCRREDITITCQKIVDDNFTIHGLWPSSQSGPHPKYCHTDLRGKFLDQKTIKSLIPGLKISWPSSTGADEELWEAQWDKHGRCYYDGNTHRQYKYFQTAYNFWSGFNLFDTFKAEGIVPVKGGKLYTTEAAIKAFRKHYSQDTVTYIPEFKCSTPKPSSPSELYEIIMCLDHDGNEPINCTTTSPSCGKQFLWNSEK